MHPAFSVIFFTTISGAGYGIWIWFVVGEGWLSPGTYNNAAAYLLAMIAAFVLVSLGLIASVFHLGKPTRAWRAFSQWRSSWLSREGVCSLLAYAAFAGLAAFVLFGWYAPMSFILVSVLLAIASISTVACTAMIYASLKPIPAWSHPLVLPVYLVFALHTGGALLLAFLAAESHVGNATGLALVLSSFLLWRLKRRYWRDIDRGEMPVSRASALGLPANRQVNVFERPHTEANYLTKEMGFVLARKHSRRLRTIAVVLFALLPALCALPVWLFAHLDAGPWLAVAAVSSLLGAFIERWLFFAEARHVVTLYY